MCTWSPTPRGPRDLPGAFEHVLEIDDGIILIGGNEPIPLDLDAWRVRLHRNDVAAYLGPELVLECTESVATARPLPQSPDDPAPISLNGDLYPRDEFSSRRASPRRGKSLSFRSVPRCFVQESVVLPKKSRSGDFQ